MEPHPPGGADSLHSDVSLCCSAAPAAAADIIGRADGATLQVSWRRPDGDLDDVVVSVSANGSSQWTATLVPDTTNVSLGHVTPGTVYLVSVQSRSGELTNQSEAFIRTGGVFSFVFLFLLSSHAGRRFMVSTSCPAPSAGASNPPSPRRLPLLP